MRTRMLLAAAVISIALMPLGGCYKNIFPPKYEINQVEVVRIAGVDRAEDDPSRVEVTFMSINQRTASAESAGGENIVSIISQKGDTVFTAKRRLKAHSDKVFLLSHIDYIIFGEDAAKDDFTKYFDCFMRDSEFRLTPKIYISRGCPAKEMMRTSSTGDQFLADRLENLSFDVHLISDFGETTLIEVAGMLDRKAAVVIPALSCRSTADEVYTGAKPEMDIVPNGYAILKDFRLAGYYDAPIARGYNFLKGDVSSTIVTVRDDTGLAVALEVEGALVSVESVFKGDALTRVVYKVQILSIIREQQSRADISNESSLNALENQLSDQIRDEMLQVIEVSKKIGVDAIGLGERIRLAHPVRWARMESSWPSIFTDLDIGVEVTTQLRRTLSINEPSGYESIDEPSGYEGGR